MIPEVRENVFIITDHTWKEGVNFDFPFNTAASSCKSGEFFRKHQLQGIANKQTTSEEVTVDVTGEEENEERSFKDLENDITTIADNNRGKASEECAQATTRGHVNAQKHKTRAKKRDQRSFRGLQRKQKIC